MKRMVVLRPGNIVVAMTDRPMMSVAVSRMAVLRRAVLINLLQDIFSKLAERIGILGMPLWLATRLRWMLNLLLRSARLNIVISQQQAAQLIAEGIDAASVAFIDNCAGHKWPHGKPVRPSKFEALFCISDKFVVSHSGNPGRDHDDMTILETDTFLANGPAVRFHMVGRGATMRCLGSGTTKRGFRWGGCRNRQPRQPRAHRSWADSTVQSRRGWLSAI